MKNVLFKARLALADWSFKLGLLALAVLFIPRICGGAPDVGGVTSDTTNIASSEFLYAYKNYYMGGLESGLRNATVLLDRLVAKGQPFEMEGSSVIMAIRTQRNAGIGFSTGRGPLPTAGNQAGIRPSSIHSRLVQMMAFDLTTLDLSRTDAGAFGRVMDIEMKGLEEDGKVVLNQALYGDKTRRLATVAAGYAPATNSTLTFDNAGLVNTVSGDMVKYLFEGMYFDTVAANGTVHDAGLQVSTINYAANSITLVAAQTAATVAGDFVVPGRLGGGGNDWNRGISGLSAALSSTSNTYWGLDRSQAVNSRWRGQRVNQGGAITQQGIRKLITTVRKYGADQGVQQSEGMPEGAVILTSFEDKDAYANQLLNIKRIVNDMTLEGGWKAVEAEGYPMVADADAPCGIYRFLNWKDWNLGSPTGNVVPTLVNAPDGLVFRQVPGYDLWAAMFTSELELGCFMPNRSGELYGCTVAADVPA